MALASSELDRCSVCRRHFLQGEAIRLFREPHSRAMQRVCPLCTQQAQGRGWQLCEATREIPLQLHGDPVRQERALQRDRLVERLTTQLEGVQAERDGVRREAELQAGELAAELERTRQALSAESSRLAEVRRLAGERLAQARQGIELQDRRLERAEKRLRELEAELAESQEEHTRVLRARRREADPTALRRVAAEAFNRSPHAEEVATISRSLGEPRCRLVIEPTGLPRRVRIAFAWESELRLYAVDLDLVERIADVIVQRVEQHKPASVRANASWTPANGILPH
jgi:DNA repair exonuclease SbcCD ATPase subunit